MRWTFALAPFLVAGVVQAADPTPAPAPMADQAQMHDPMRAQGGERWKAAGQDVVASDVSVAEAGPDSELDLPPNARPV